MALMSVTDKQRKLGLQPGPASSSNSASRGQLMMTAGRNDLVIDRRERLDLLPLWFNRVLMSFDKLIIPLPLISKCYYSAIIMSFIQDFCQ